MDSQTDDYSIRPYWYYNIDGVGELGIGFMLLAFGLLQWLQVHTPQNSLWNQFYMLFVYVGLMCSIIHFGSKAIKKRITYPRTGFVAYRKRDTVWRPMIVGMLTSMLILVGIVVALKSRWDLKTAPPLFGLVYAAVYARGFARAVRWKWTVALVIALGSLAIASLPADLVAGLANHSWLGARIPPALVGACLVSFLFYGATLLLSGGISFCLYLRHTQPPALEAQ